MNRKGGRMEERFREHYFILLRITLLLVLEIDIALSQPVWTGASVEMLLIFALLIGAVVGKEFLVFLSLRTCFYSGSDGGSCLAYEGCAFRIDLWSA